MAAPIHLLLTDTFLKVKLMIVGSIKMPVPCSIYHGTWSFEESSFYLMPLAILMGGYIIGKKNQHLTTTGVITIAGNLGS